MERKPNRFYSKRQERKGNSFLGLKNTPNSGATAFKKGDGYDDHLVMEYKTLTKPQKSRTLQKEWFDKNQEEAFAMGRRFSALCFDFGDGDNYVAMKIEDFKEFYSAWKKLYGEED